MINPWLFWRLRKTVEVAIPVVLAVDVVHSFVYVVRLRQARVQEWREEEQRQVQATVHAYLHSVATTCSQKDKAFWPYRHMQWEQPASEGVPSSAANDRAEEVSAVENDQDDWWTDVFKLFASDNKDLLTISSTKTNQPQATPLSHEKQCSILTPSARTTAAGAALATQPDTDTVPNPSEVVVKTLYQEIWEPFVPKTLVEASGRAFAAMESGIKTTGAALLDRMQGRLPQPNMHIQRRSALRFHVRWHHTAVSKPTVIPDLEVVLSD